MKTLKTLKNKTFQIISIALLLTIILIDFYKCDRTTLEITNTKGNIYMEDVQLEPKSIVKHNFYNDDDFLTFTGKICLVNNTQSILKDCFEKFENFNYEWIILADNHEYLSSIYSFQHEYEKNLTAKIVSIIINNSTISNNESYTDGKIPLVYVDETIYSTLSEYDISNISENYMISIYYMKLDGVFQNKICLYVSIGLSIVIFLTTLTWHTYTFKNYARYTTSIQKSFTAMLYLKFILSVLLVYYSTLNYKRRSLSNMEDNFMMVYVETIFNTLSAVLQTLLWFVLLVVAYGWQIHRGLFTRNEVKNSVLVFILLYVLICFDQIFNMLIDAEIWKFKPAEIKNIILYTVLTIFMIIYCLKSKKLITRRFIYAINFSREYYPSLKLKLNMMNLQIFFTLLYALTYISMLILNKTLLFNMLTKELSMVLTFVLDTIGLMFYLFIYYPRKFPEYFNVYYDDITFENQNEIKMNSYCLTLNTTDSNLKSNSKVTYNVWINSQKLKKKEKIEIEKNNSCPVLIINPYEINYSCSGNKHSNLMDKITVGLRSNIEDGEILKN